VDNNILTDIDLGELKRFRKYMQASKDAGSAVPTDRGDWRQYLTGELYELYCDTENPNQTATSGNANTQNTQTTTESKKMVKVSLTDFPDFTGRQDHWDTFQKEVSATMGLLQLQELLEVESDTNVTNHKNKVAQDPEYAMRNTEFYSLLSKKTAKGTAATIVDGHQSERDGALAWRDLVKHYEFGGDKETRTTSLLGELTSLRLYYDSNGGFDKYYHLFTTKCLELTRMGHALDDTLKKTLFLQGIMDAGYDAIKDDCKTHDYAKTIDLLRSKARDLGRVNSRAGNRKANNRAQQKGNKGNRRRTNNKNTSGTPNRNNQEGNMEPPPGSGFSSKAWNAMTPENKKWIVDQKNKAKESFGKQYSTPDRRQNNVSSSSSG